MLLTPSSIWPLQLSSLPLQISAGGTVDAMMPTSAALTAAVSVSVTLMAARAARRRDAVGLGLLGADDADVGEDVGLHARGHRASWQACTSGWKVA